MGHLKTAGRNGLRGVSVNPKGVPAQSPRLRGTSYLGKRSGAFSQPQRGCGPDPRARGALPAEAQPRSGL